MRCRYAKDGTCSAVVPYKELLEHEMTCTSCEKCKQKCPKCNKMIPKFEYKGHPDVCKGPSNSSEQLQRGSFLINLFSRNSSVSDQVASNTTKQLVEASEVKNVPRVGKRPDQLADFDLDDNYSNASDLIEQQRAMFDAIQNRTFWGVRVYNLMQYYPTITSAQASYMLLLMLLDPLI